MRMRFDNANPSPRNTRRYGPAITIKSVVIGPVDSVLALAAFFGDHGWDVHTTKSAKEARKLTQRIGADLVVMPVRGEPESGWLGCAKLTRSGSKAKIVLIGPPWDEEAERFALFAGADAYFTDADSPEAVYDVVAKERVEV